MALLVFIKQLPTAAFMQTKFSRVLYIYFTQGATSVSSFLYFSGFFNIFYNSLYLGLYRFSYRLNTKILDKGLLELLGPVGVYRLFYGLSRKAWSLNSSVFLNIGFMFFALTMFYCYGLLAAGLFLFHLMHYGMLPLVILMVYNEFTNNNKS